MRAVRAPAPSTRTRAPARSAKRARDEVERRLVFFVTPAPVAVQVRVVRRQSLRRRQARAQRQVRFERGRRCRRASAAPADVASSPRCARLRARRDVRAAAASADADLRRFERARAFAPRRLPTAAAAGAFARAIRPARQPVRRTATELRRDPESRRDKCSQRKRRHPSRRAAFAQRGHASSSTKVGSLR